MFSEMVKLGLEDKKRCEEIEQFETFLKTHPPTTTHYTFQNSSARLFAPSVVEIEKDPSQLRKRKKFVAAKK